MREPLRSLQRDPPGELLLIAFTWSFARKRVFVVGFLGGLRSVSLRALPGFLLDVARAWRRGRRAHVEFSTDWEALLALPVDQARARLAIAPLAQTHAGRESTAHSAPSRRGHRNRPG